MILVSIIIVTCFIIYKECLLSSFHTQCFQSKLAFLGFRHQSEPGGKKGNSLHNSGKLWKTKAISFKI